MKKTRKIIAILLTVLTLMSVISAATPVLATEVTEVTENQNSESISESSENADAEGNEDTEEASSDEPEILNEMVEWRTENTKYFRNSDGSYTAAQYAYPIHYEDNGEWKEIDNTLTEEAVKGKILETGNEFVAKKTNTPVRFPDEFKRDGSKEITVSAEGYEISFSPQTELNIFKNAEGAIKEKTELKSVKIAERFNEKQSGQISASKELTTIDKAKIKEETSATAELEAIEETKSSETKKNDRNEKFKVENKSGAVVYENVFNNVNLEYELNNAKIKESIVVNEKRNNYVFEFNIDLGGLYPVMCPNGSINLCSDEEGKNPVAKIEAPYMIDSVGEYSDWVEMTIEPNGEEYVLTVTADENWVNDKARVFPVVIDPTIRLDINAAHTYDCYVDDSSPNSAKPYNTNLLVGNNSCGKTRTLVKFDLPALPGDNYLITNATVVYHQYEIDAGDFSTQYMSIHKITQEWDNANYDVTWNNQPKFEEDVVLDYAKFEDTNFYSYKFDVTRTVKDWYEGAANNGFALKLKNENASKRAALVSAEHPVDGYYPEIYVTFLDNKGLESYWSYSSYSIGSAGNAYINDYTGNLVYELPILSSISKRAPLTLTAYFNNYCATQPLTAGKSNSSRTTIGKGFRLNIQQTVLPSTKYGLSGENAQKYPYVYTDADGTEHFLVKETEEGKTVYKDEEGLGLTMTTDCDIVATYQITDKAHNNYYFNTEGNLGIMQDKNGNRITIDFVSATDSDNFRSKTRISKITDGVGHTFTFHYYDTTTGNYVDYIKDDAGRKVEFKIEDGYLKSVTYPDATKSIIGYEYEYGGTQSDEGLINFINDNGVYGLNFNYTSKATGRMVKNVTERCSPTYNSTKKLYESFEKGQEVTFDRSQYNTTVIRTCGMDGTHGNDDDIITTIQFDNAGRPTSQQVCLGDGTHSVAGAYNYTSESSSLASQNKISSSAGLGKNTVNYVKNSNAETETTWNNSKSATATGSVAYTVSQSYIGEKSIRLHTSAIEGKGDGVWAHQDISGLKSGKTYTLSAYVKVTAFGEYKDHKYLGASIAVSSTGTTEETTVFSEALTEVTSTNVDNGWRRLSVKIKIPDGAKTARVYLELRSFVGTAYFDCIQFEYGTTENSYNLLENSSFEKYNDDGRIPTGWTDFGMTDADITTATRHINGDYSFKMYGEPHLSKGLAQYPVVHGKPEDTYIVSGWAMATAVNSTYHYTIDDNDTKDDKEDDKRIDKALFEIEIKVYYVDENGKEYEEEKPSAKFNTTIDGWQYTVQAFSLKHSEHPDYQPTQIRIMPRYNRQDNVAFFDHIQLIKDAAPSYTYDDEGNVIAVAENSEQKANAEYNDKNNLTSYTDVLKNETKLEYDDNNNLTITTSPKKVYGESFYNGVGNVTAQETRSAKSSENASLVIRTETDYTEAGNGLKTNAYIKSTSDEHGNQTTYTYDWATGKPKTVTNAKDTVTTYGYDSDYNRLIRVTADQSKVFYEYTGNQLDHIHFASTGGGVKENYYFNYDSYGNVENTLVGSQILSTNTYGKNNGALISTEYGSGDKIENKYDELGNLKQVCKNTEKRYTWAYNSAGVTTIHRDYENGRRYFYRYDSLGRLITQEIRSNEDENHTHIGSISYEYDLRNNLTKLGIEIGNKSVPQPTYYYGTEGVEGSANAGKDNLLTRYKISASRYVDYKYDGLNRLQYKRISTTAPFLIDYEYKSSERNTGDATKYKTTQLASEKLDDVTYSYTYDDVGNITAVKRNGADYRSYTYDALSQLTRENNKSGTRFTKVWNYDALGNIESVKVYPYTTGTINSDTVFPSAIDYVYGSNSETGWNRLLKEVRYKTYDKNGNEITAERKTKTIDYDEIGNPIKYLDYEMKWFGRQLEEIKAGTDTTDTTADDKTISFTYGADGLRGTKTVKIGDKTETSEYVYANGQLAYEKRGDSELYFFYDGLGHLAAIRYYEDASEDTYKQYYVATNSMGDVLNIINGDGDIIAKYAYDAWGNVVSIVDCDYYDETSKKIIEKNITNDTTSTDIAMVNPIRYRGYYLDRETGFYYLQSRYYDPSIGRFISADTVDVLSVSPTELTDKNLFSYCDNNPVTRKDIQGNAWETVFDVISLGMSIADVAVNPTNPWAWAGLVGDVVDVAIPFVGGVGEVIKCCGTINKVSGVIDAANDTKKFVSKSVGTYEIMYKSGKNYVGKGTFNRAIQSAKRYTAPHSLNNGLGDEVLSITWKKAANNKEAFITEYLWQHRKNGVLRSNSSAKTYNVIWSPGRMLLGWF